METETLLATCFMCGKEFEPHPDSFCEVGMTAELVPGYEEVPDDAVSLDDLQFASTMTLAEVGLDAQTRDEMLKLKDGESVVTGGAPCCDACLSEHFTPEL